jgi:hypothetical protein
VVAIGFAVAAVTMQLIDRFGAIQASWIIASGFLVLGLIGLAFAWWHDRPTDQSPTEVKPEVAASASADEATLPANMQLPLALVGSLLTTSSSFISPLTLLRFLGRNAALVTFAALLALVLWPQRPESGDAPGPVAEPAE